MPIFKIRENGFKEIRNKMLFYSIPLLIIAGAAGISISIVNSKQSENTINTLPIVILLIILASGIGLYRSIKTQKALFESYTLTITNTLITREQLHTPTISLYFNDIKEIAKNKNGSFTVKGKEPQDLIAIPRQIDDYPQLEKALQQIRPIVAKSKVPILEKSPIITGLATIGLMFCVYTVNNKIIVAITGSALVALLVWSFIKIRSSKNIDSKIKQSVWWILLVIFSVIAFTFMKVTGFINIQKN